MFAHRFFAAGYFPPAYFPPVEENGTTKNGSAEIIGDATLSAVGVRVRGSAGNSAGARVFVRSLSKHASVMVIGDASTGTTATRTRAPVITPRIAAGRCRASAQLSGWATRTSARTMPLPSFVAPSPAVVPLALLPEPLTLVAEPTIEAAPIAKLATARVTTDSTTRASAVVEFAIKVQLPRQVFLLQNQAFSVGDYSADDTDS